MKTIKLILSVWMGFLMVALVVGCSGNITDTSDSGAPAEDGQYMLIMAGSSGYGRMTVDSEDISHSMLEMYFDTNQNGGYDIQIMTNGIDLKKGFTHTSGTRVKLGNGNKLEVNIPNHGTIITAVEKYEGDGDNLETYTGMMGQRESVYSGNNVVDAAASSSITDRLELSKVVFNVILNTNTKKFKYVLKSIAVENPSPSSHNHGTVGLVSEGTYTVEGNNYTFALTGGEPQILEKSATGFVKSKFHGVQCDSTLFVTVMMALKAGSATGTEAQYTTTTCPGEVGYVGGKKAVAGEYFFGNDDYTSITGHGGPTSSERVIEAYTTLTKQ